MKRILICILATIMAAPLPAQVFDDFSDGDINQNPAWYADTGSFRVNTAQWLQSSHTIPNSQYGISTGFTPQMGASWNCSFRLEFNPSSQNYLDFVLIASDSNLCNPSIRAYFIRLGGTDDDICLYRQEGNTLHKIIDGRNDVLNQSQNQLTISVSRSPDHRWSLSYTAESGIAIYENFAWDSTTIPARATGIRIRQSTASFFEKHFIDDFSAGPWIPDSIPPAIIQAEVSDSVTLTIQFNEPVDPASATLPGAYFVNEGVGIPISANQDSLVPNQIKIAFTHPIPARVPLQIRALHIRDRDGNIQAVQEFSFARYVPKQADIVFTEIMADPDPAVGMPSVEWVEIYNRTPFPIPLKGWKILKPDQTPAQLNETTLAPNQYRVLGSTAATTLIPGSMGISGFPGLNNSSDTLILLSPDGMTIHALGYSDDWYREASKKQGGWSLEMINTNAPCAGADNWIASNHPSGASAGVPNVTNHAYVDTKSPAVIKAWAPATHILYVKFDESVDSTIASMPQRYELRDGPSILHATAIAPLFRLVEIHISDTLIPGKTYTLIIRQVADCHGNIAAEQSVKTGYGLKPGPGMLVWNEILFNPRSGMSDFIELYNTTDSLLSLNFCYLSTRNANGSLNTSIPLAPEGDLIFPGEFLVFTEDASGLLSLYPETVAARVRPLHTMPSLPDDSGFPVLHDDAGSVIDEVKYDHDWHHPLLQNEEGISLERIQAKASSQDPINWGTAAAPYYGTPGMKNSQQRQAENLPNLISIEPLVFSPDHDGWDDDCLIRYRLPEAGALMSITLFNRAGQLVRTLVSNALTGTAGQFRWDGLDDGQKPLPEGHYPVLIEWFTLQGKVERMKKLAMIAYKK